MNVYAMRSKQSTVNHHNRLRAFVAALAACALIMAVPASAFAKRGLPESCTETGCGDNNTGTRVLVAVATNYGSTYNVGKEISEELCSQGFQVDLRFAHNVEESDLAGYGAVIVGSCIYIEEWHEDALSFLETFEQTLAEKQVAYYCVCGLLGMEIPSAPDMVDEYYVEPMFDRFPEIDPLDVTAFAGSVNYRILLPIDWILLRLMFMPAGNWTDWDEVRSWTDMIGGLLQ